MSRVVDFEAIKSEISVADPVEVRLNGTTVTIRGELPWEAAVAWDAGRIDDACASIVVNDDDAPKLRGMLFDDKPSKATALQRLVAIYKVDQGESPAS